MASKRRQSVEKRSMFAAVRAAGIHVRRAKLTAAGNVFRRLHRIESMLVTVEGRKTAEKSTRKTKARETAKEIRRRNLEAIRKAKKKS